MISINDIYSKMDSNIILQGFWDKDIEVKKKLIDNELKKYITSKIQGVNGTISITNSEEGDPNVPSLLQKLANLIPREQHFDTLRHFIHYIVQVAGTLQGWSIIWWVEDDEELIDSPLIEFDENGLWSNLKTHENTDYIKTFNFVYDIFSNNFMKENTPKRLTMRVPKDER
ncbi:MAG: hypothetical protein RSD06_04680 [Bacilli bacterium]